MKNLLSLLLASTLLFASCKKETITNKDKIIGTWNSTFTSVNGTNTTSTLTMDFDFQANGNFGQTVTNPNQVATDAGRYYFQSENNLVLIYSDDSRADYNVMFSGNNVLEISGNIPDGAGNVFAVRAKLQKQ